MRSGGAPVLRTGAAAALTVAGKVTWRPDAARDPTVRHVRRGVVRPLIDLGGGGLHPGTCLLADPGGAAPIPRRVARRLECRRCCRGIRCWDGWRHRCPRCSRGVRSTLLRRNGGHPGGGWGSRCLTGLVPPQPAWEEGSSDC